MSSLGQRGSLAHLAPFLNRSMRKACRLDGAPGEASPRPGGSLIRSIRSGRGHRHAYCGARPSPAARPPSTLLSRLSPR